ncbi:MAG: hypothetical protein ACQEQE_11255 [Bacillota bacterium]
MYKIILFTLSFTVILKSLAGIFFHNKLYNWALKHYSKDKKSLTVKILLIYGFTLFTFSWCKTIFHYEKYGWVLTLFISLTMLKGYFLTFNWNKSRKKFVDLIKNRPSLLHLIDKSLLVLGILFFIIGYFVF